MDDGVSTFKARFMVALLLVVVLAGCNRYQRVDVFVTNVEVLPSTMLEQRLRVSLRIQNANDFDIEANGLDFELEVNGIALAQGVSNEPVRIPALGEAQTTVDTSTTLLALLREAFEIVDREQASYLIDARLYLQAPSRTKLKVRKRGLIDASSLPFRGPGLGSIGERLGEGEGIAPWMEGTPGQRESSY